MSDKEVHTGGGPAIGSDVNVSGGGFTGRDDQPDNRRYNANVVLNFDPERFSRPNPNPTLADLWEANRYVIYLVNGNAELGVVGIRTRVREIDRLVHILIIIVIAEGILLACVVISYLFSILGGRF